MGSTSIPVDGVASTDVQSSPSGQNTFEAFVKNAVQKIQREAWGRSSEVVEIRNACQTFLDQLNSEAAGATLGVPFNEQRTRAALKPLQLACASSSARIVEPALGCLHKLVAYAWIQGESSENGNMDDGSLVTEIVTMVVKCIQLGNASVYLAVIRALLTFATADHFVAHGHCLLHMVRTVFNLAVSCEESNLKRTACNALLQMLNTVVKRVVVTQFQMRTHHSTNSMDSTQDLAVRGPIREDILEETATATEGESEPGETPNAENQTRDVAALDTSGTWKLADLAEKEDIEALEAAFEDKQRVMEEESIEKPDAPEPPKPDQSQTPESSAVTKTAAVQEKEPSQDVSSPAEKMAKRPKGWDQLTLLEKDVLVVLMAFCKLAGVNTSSVTSENYVRHGKLLALELLVKVFENPGHRWENVRLAFCEQLRFPLCLVLIRNCNPAEAKAFQFAIRLFVSVMMQLQIRLGLKAELGALYPLLLLRPLESSTLDPSLLTVTLTGVKRISKEPQMQVDIFINYDCNLKAPNLYERTARALSQLAVKGDPAAPASQSALLREAAAACAMAMLASLDAWAGPVRDATHVGDALSPDAGPKGSANGSSSVIGPTSEVRHFGEAKERKNSLSVGIELFNKSPAKGIASLVASGVVLNKADTIASFLRKNREQLDSAMMGEYLGLNDEMPLKVMHAYIDMEDYQGITIDVALRKLLSQFRLPGEAQKIDRIMEKFAERYCQDNPNVFESADDAYVLSFSIIMLNTDIHNPMAEKRLGKQDFVSMNMRQRSEGVYVEVLPVADLEAIYDRIATEEIRALHSSPGPTTKQEVMAQHRNLASAVGLTQLAFPFRSGRVWDKARGAQIEHEHLLALTQKAMRSGAVEAELWFTATHTEHARPMLDVAGPHFQKALAAAVESASDKESADRSVNSLVMAAQLAALLGLDSLCQHFVSTLAHAIGVHSKEAFLRANPHRQISALRALIGVASDEQAGLLGGSWTTILRTISSVEALIADMRRGHKSSHSVFEESMQTAKVQQPSEKKDLDKSTAIGRFFTQLGLTKGEVEVYSAVQPGQAIRVWSGGEGITEMDRIFVRSASLDGEAVVIFCRALCAVSHEELNPATPHPEGASPRVFSLRKLVECAYYNLGRIRLIWGRLWSTISMHLVSASCHSDQTVAMYSVDSLRQLVGKLLSRDELVNFTTQSDTLRPFVTVLKQCANVVVRELAVQCIEQAMNTHSSRLGSGWMVILEFLSVASLDPAPSVTRQCIDALQSVVNVHWRKWGRGRDALADCVKVALRVARNPHNSDCSLRAIRLIHLCAKELVNELTATERNEGWRSASVDWTETEREENVDMHRTASVPQGAAEVPPAKEVVVHADPLLSPSALWTVIFEALVEVINREDRRRCADTAAEIFFSLPSPEFSATWDQRTWAVFQSALHRIFDLSEDAYSMESGIDRILSYSTTFFPGLFSVVTANYKTDGKSLLAHMLEILMGWMMSPRQVLAVSGVYLLQDMVFDVADVLDEEGWSVAVGRLQCTWNVCASDGMSADGSRRVPFLSWIEGETPLDTATIRIRCQVLVTLQRIIYRTLEELNEKVPANLIPKLIEILLNAVTHTAEANNDSEFLEKLHQHLSTCASQVSTPPSHGSDAEMVQRNEAPVAGGITAAIVESPVEEEAAESEETDSESDDNKSENELEQQDRARATEEAGSERKNSETGEGEESAKEGPSVLPALKTEFSQTAPIPTQGSTAASAAVAAAVADVTHSEMYDQPASLPELSASLLQAQHEMFSGFLKMYVEGGILTIQALLNHQQRMETTEEATEQLLAFCRGLIHQASTETKALIAQTKDTNEMGAIQSQWKQAVKAPLIAKALEAYK